VAHNAPSMPFAHRVPGDRMVICPVAIAVGCRKCPIFRVCPVKTSIGDFKPPVDKPKAEAGTKTKARPKKAAAKRGRRKSR
jgi:hypothetical protein